MRAKMRGWLERALLGAAMVLVARIVERRLLKAVSRSGTGLTGR